MKKIISVLLCIIMAFSASGFAAVAEQVYILMYDWENFSGKAQAISVGAIEEGNIQSQYSGHYAGIVTITNATNYPAAQNGLLSGTIKALKIQNRRSVTINDVSSGSYAFKINLDSEAMENAQDLRMYMCYKNNANHVVGIKTDDGSCYYSADFNSDENNKTLYYQQWNWYSFLGKTFKLCGYGTDATKNITLDLDVIKSVSSILIWNRYDTGSTTDANYSEIYIDNVEYKATTAASDVTVTIDGVSQVLESGSQYTFDKSAKAGFVAYTDGQSFYNEGDEITVADNLSFTTVSIGSLYMQKGAAIRLGVKNGIRFYTTADASAIEAVCNTYNATISKGTLIVPYDLLSGSELTLNSSCNPANVEYDAQSYYQPNVFVGSIVDIKESNTFSAESGNLARGFVGRGYVTVQIGDYSKTVYADYNSSDISNNTRSLSYIAYKYKNDETSTYQELSPEIKIRVDEWADLMNTEALLNMDSKAYVNNLRIGINTGRSLDCRIDKSSDEYTVADLNATEQKYEFINPTDESLIKSFKSAGFNAVRLPVTWSEAIGAAPDYNVSNILMDRVQEVVDLILSQDMYCILNTHNEFNWLYTENSDLNSMYAKFSSLWRQIAERFKDYDGRLIFEGYNEVLKQPDDWTSKSDSDYNVVNTLAQKFVDAVRLTGSNNADRFLIVAPYGGLLGQTEIQKLVVPSDSANDKIIISAHFYFPDATLPNEYNNSVNMSTGKLTIDEKFGMLQSELIEKGYAVILTEFGIADHNALSVRNEWTKYVTEKATSMNIPLLWWDNGYTFGLFDRSTDPYNQQYPTIISEMMNATASRAY